MADTYGRVISVPGLGGKRRKWISSVTETSWFAQGLTAKNEHFMQAWNVSYAQLSLRADGASIQTAWPQTQPLCATLIRHAVWGGNMPILLSMWSSQAERRVWPVVKNVIRRGAVATQVTGRADAGNREHGILLIRMFVVLVYIG